MINCIKSLGYSEHADFLSVGCPRFPESLELGHVCAAYNICSFFSLSVCLNKIILWILKFRIDHLQINIKVANQLAFNPVA